MKRRTFLKKAGTVGAATGAGVFSILKYPRGANAAGWGAWPDDKLDALVPEGMRANSVLELHVNGGMSMFDTFYSIPSWGQDDFRFAHVYADDDSNPNVAGLADENRREPRFEACADAQTLAEGLFSEFGAEDAAGNSIFLGPWAYPFRRRPDVLDRMRITVMEHDQVAHEGANPISFTGDKLGQPRMAAVGTPIQRYFSENPDAPGGGGVRAAPYSYVLYPAGYKPFNAVSASTVGFHPGSARPLVVSVDPASELFNLLQRTGVEDPEAFDAALNYYRTLYDARLKGYGHSTTARSAERDNYAFADLARRSAPELTDILSADLFDALSPGAVCGENQNTNDMPAMQARMAASLLTRPTDAARYVMWMDAGLVPSNTGGHDVHAFSIQTNGLNLPHTFQALLDVIRDPNNPSPDDDQKIDLDQTMIVINTEFGRTPTPQGATGTNHWPWGYACIYIGGPIQSRSVYGNMQESDGYAVQSITPAESRIMVLQSMGIYPFSSQSYAVADVGGADDELEAATIVRDSFLGLDV